MIKVNVPYYINTIILFKCMIGKKSIEKANSKNDNYYSYFRVLEYKDPELKNEEDKENNSNVNLRKIFALSFTRVYLKIFIDWINKTKITKSIEIRVIIDVINGKENNKCRVLPLYFICKILPI